MDREMTIKDVFRAILNHIGLIVLISVVAVTGAALLCWLVLPPTYTATTTMYVLNRTTESELLNYNDLNSSLQLVNDYRELAQSDRIQLRAAEALGLENLEDFDIKVEAENNTRIISVNVESTDSPMAANVANAITEELSDCIIDVMQAENISIIDSAMPPTEPSGPKSLQITVSAGIAGLLIGIALALLIEMMDTKLKTAEDVEKLLEIPVLAQIPKFDLNSKDRAILESREVIRKHDGTSEEEISASVASERQEIWPGTSEAMSDK